MKKVAVILCGSGFKDGSEIRESVAVLWALSPLPVAVECFAPDLPQAEVINCLTGQPMPGQTRNQLVEAARIARGKIRPLSQLNPTEFDALILPGGGGSAKNLCTFSEKGADGQVIPELQKVIVDMFNQHKPIGAVCIAPAIVGLALKGKGLELTMGPSCEESTEVEKMGHHHVECHSSSDFHVDLPHKVVSTPAYMNAKAPLHEVFTGIQKLANEVVRLISV